MRTGAGQGALTVLGYGNAVPPMRVNGPPWPRLRPATWVALGLLVLAAALLWKWPDSWVKVVEVPDARRVTFAGEGDLAIVIDCNWRASVRRAQGGGLVAAVGDSSVHWADASRYGPHFLLWGQNDQIELRELPSGRIIAKQTSAAGIRDPGFSPDGKEVVFGARQRMTTDGRLLPPLPDDFEFLFYAAPSGDYVGYRVRGAHWACRRSGDSWRC